MPYMTVLPAVPHDVIAFFASDPTGPLLAVPDAAQDPDSPVYESLNSFLDAIPLEAIEGALEDPYFRFLASRDKDSGREARILFAQRLLMREIPRRRNETLRTEVSLNRPSPYNVPALLDLDVDPQHLVPLSAFKFDGSRLLRNGHAFTVLCTTGSPNSTYWLVNAIYNEAKIADCTSIRLDPFLHGPEETFPALAYKMWIYGRPLDWDRIEKLQVPEHGRWTPGALSYRSEFTDFVWMPRGPEVHFVAEEVPTLEDAPSSAARYVHAVYTRSRKVLSHFDGALRLYSEVEVHARHRLHVRSSGKIGVREKVFRTDASIPKDTFSVLVQTFLIWNQDIGDYFSGGRATG